MTRLAWPCAARVVTTAAVAFVVLAVWGCAADASGSGGVTETPAIVLGEPRELSAVTSDTVYGWTGPGGRPFEVARRTAGASAYHRQIGRKTFALPLRVPGNLTQYPCSSCHEGLSVTGRRTDGAHQNIAAVHPTVTGAACVTCHVPNAVERLALPGGESASLDQAYRSCAQCHASQVESWAAGAHGKRLDGWFGRRVVMNCADCHDPHAPALESRVPFPGPRIGRGDVK